MEGVIGRGRGTLRTLDYTIYREDDLRGAGSGRRNDLRVGVGVLLLLAMCCAAQTPAPGTSPTATAPGSGSGQKSGDAGKQAPMTKEQAKELFKSVDEILTFVSNDTKLPIVHSVKRKLLSRDEVNKYLEKKFL